MLQSKNMISRRNQGKIRPQLLIISVFVVLFFLTFAWYRSQHDLSLGNNQGVNTATTTGQNNDSSATSTQVVVPIQVIPTPKTIGHAVGIAGGGEMSKIPLDDLNARLDQMVDLGVTWVRFDIEWGNVQYDSPNKSSWQSYDTLVKAIADHHLNALGVILFTPEWARAPGCTGGAKCPPADPKTFATFAAQVAARYMPYGVHTWEIWNEPNNYAFWATKTDCPAYTNLLKATYPAIKKVDPQATVITGGVSPAATDNNNISPLDFIDCIYKNGGKNYFDAVGDHPYTFPALPSDSKDNLWGQMSRITKSFRSIMSANGDSNKKIWITEFGVPTNGPDPKWFVSEEKQAQMFTDALKLYKTYNWVGPIFLYTLRDNGTTTNTNENFFGLTRADESHKPAYNTIKNIISSGL